MKEVWAVQAIEGFNAKRAPEGARFSVVDLV
jgi:hypothetical protein